MNKEDIKKIKQINRIINQVDGDLSTLRKELDVCKEYRDDIEKVVGHAYKQLGKWYTDDNDIIVKVLEQAKISILSKLKESATDYKGIGYLVEGCTNLTKNGRSFSLEDYIDDAFKVIEGDLELSITDAYQNDLRLEEEVQFYNNKIDQLEKAQEQIKEKDEGVKTFFKEMSR